MEKREKERIGSTTRNSEVSKKNKDQGESYEAEIRAMTGMKEQIGSGCGVIDKEDMVDEKYLGQAKSGRGASIGLKIEDLEKLVHHADQLGKNPILFVGFKKPGPMFAPRNWVLIPLHKFMELR